MSTKKVWGIAAGAVGVAGAAGAARMVQHHRVNARSGAGEAIEFGGLRSPGLKVVTDDGVDLHVEIDEPDPSTLSDDDADLTVVFVHGFTLTLDSWHFQRAAYRGQIRTVFYDQRSHGLSARSRGENCTIDQLGRDLKRVVETTAPGRVVVVGHSMGGMSVIALAQQFPELFEDKIVGSCLMATTAGGLDPGRILFPMIPLGLGGRALGSTVAVLDRGHRIVDRARAFGYRFAQRITNEFAFGDDVPRSYVEFVFDMIDHTPFQVVADFFPAFASLNHYDQLGALAKAPCTIIGGTEDRVTGIGHSRKLHSRIHGSELFEAVGSGHMVLLEHHQEVNNELDELIGRAEVLARERQK